MKQDGFTLMELLVVIAIIGTLAVVLGFDFMDWLTRYKVESQIKTMQVDLATARQKAMEKNAQYVAQLPVLSGTSYTICEDGNSNGVCGDAADTPIPVLSKSSLRYPIAWNLPGGIGASIVMSGRGMVKQAAGGVVTDINNDTFPLNIWLLNPDTMAPYAPIGTLEYSKVDYDCISLSTTRIEVGKYDGATCVVK